MDCCLLLGNGFSCFETFKRLIIWNCLPEALKKMNLPTYILKANIEGSKENVCLGLETSNCDMVNKNNASYANI